MCPEAFLREEEGDEGTLVGDEGTTRQEGGGGGVVSGQGRGAEVAGVPEIMEEILGQLPISHLYSSCRLVCRKWNDIIQREKVRAMTPASTNSSCIHT